MRVTRRHFLKGVGIGVAAATVVPMPITSHAAELRYDGIPAGWVKCDGRTLWKNEYPELYEALHNSFGTSPAQPGTFRVPYVPYDNKRQLRCSDETIPLDYIIKARRTDVTLLDTSFPVGTVLLWTHH
jgi:hypothetical protein